MFESSQAQRWDDWAVSSEMNRPAQPPSKKRIRITVCAGTAGGRELGETVIEGIISHNQTATVSFSMEETLLGGAGESEGTTVDRGPRFVSAQASPRLANFERNHLPGLADHVVDFMSTMEGRHWLWQYSVGAISEGMVEARFGADIAEAFELWVALREDDDLAVRNVGNIPMLEVAAHGESSDASTMEVDKPLGEGNTDDNLRAGGAEDLVTVAPAMDVLGPTQLDGLETYVNAAEIEHKDVSALDGENTDEGAGAVTAGMSSEETGHGVPLEGDDPGHCEGHHAAGHDSGLPGAAVATSETALKDGNNDNNMASAGCANPSGEDGHEAPTGCSGPLEEHRPWVEDESDPYHVPEAWRRVLRAWNEDLAVGAGIEDSGLSVGNFAHTQGEAPPGCETGEDSGPVSTTLPATSS